jgi:hypothetical protein
VTCHVRIRRTSPSVKPPSDALRQPGKIGTLKIDVDPFSPNGMRRVILSEYWALDGSAVEEGILLENHTSKQATTDPTDSPATGEPAITLPMADAPAGTAMVGVAASAGLALRNYTLGTSPRRIPQEQRQVTSADRRRAPIPHSRPVAAGNDVPKSDEPSVSQWILCPRPCRRWVAVVRWWPRAHQAP